MTSSTATVEDAAERIIEALEALGTPERARKEQAYLKSDLRHLGVPVPKIRSITKSIVNTSGADGRRLATRLWNTDIHEARMAAAEVLCMIESDLGHADLPLVEDLLRSSRTWALVDTLAVHVAGPVLARDNEANAVLDRWATDPDFWIRRSALLAHLKDLRSGGGDWERFTRYADAMLEEKEFFIRKAIGWILRDTSRRRPDLVADWFTPRAHRASGVTVREAVKKLSDEQAAEINRRYRSSR